MLYNINETLLNNPLLLYPKDVMKLIGVKTTAFHEIKKNPTFPKARFPTGSTRPMYIRTEIEEWIKSL